MSFGRRLSRSSCAFLLMALVLPGIAAAAGPPQVSATFVTEVTASGANLRALINPAGSFTRYRFEYLSDAAFRENLAAGREAFAGAAKAPSGIEASIGAGAVDVQAVQHLSGLVPSASYHYRARATNSEGVGYGPERSLTTQGTELAFSLPDGRGWEMVSPVDKNGGAIESVGTTRPRVFQASADGRSVAYNSISSFGTPQGAPSVNQYLARRTGAGWASEDVSIPLFSGSYGDEPGTTPYRLFSADLSQGLVLNGRRCRGSGDECLVANPPLPGTEAPAGYVDYYRRDAAGQFTALLNQADVAGLAVAPRAFEVRVVAASADLGHVLLSTCAALTSAATEIQTGPSSCDGSRPNLYEWSAGAGLEPINLLPGESQGTPGAEVAAQGRAVSADGSRVYWTDQASGDLYVHERGAGSVRVDAAVGGGGTFQTASADGSVAYFTKEEHLYRFALATETATDLSPGGEVEGVLGTSEDGSYVYFGTAAGLMAWHQGAVVTVAAAADASNYPPTTGTARVTPDGRHLAFLSSAGLTGYDNAGKSEVFLYGPAPGGGAAQLTCVSCNPTGERPRGPSTIPGAVANGDDATATNVYKPRSLSDDGARVFFDTEDALVVQDTDERPDVYEWETAGSGTCTVARDCVNLLSSGRSAEGASFVDASADGSDVFFLTDGSLIPTDPGLVDLYDAREGGGFPAPPTPLPCVGDACQALPGEPEDPTPGTLVPNSGNPIPASAPRKKAHHKKKKRHGKSHKPTGARRESGR